MGTESIEASFLSIFALISFFIFFITSKYSHKIKNGALLDIDFVKPQSFHDLPVSRSGGIPILFSLSIFFVIYYLLYSKILYDYILISYSMFLIGFLDDIKISIKPIKRLIFIKKIKDKENGKVTDEALKLIVKISEGSVRDALSLLDRALLSLDENTELDLNAAQKIFGYFDKSQLIDLFELILKGEEKKVINIYRKIYDQGVEPKVFINDFLELVYYFKNINSLNMESTNFNLNDEEFSKIKKIANEVSDETLILFWQFTLKTLEELEIVNNQNLSIEMFLIRLMYLKSSANKEHSPLSKNKIDQFKKQDDKQIIVNEKKNETISQVKNISQEQEVKIENNKGVKAEEKLDINSFDQLLKICNEKKEIKLKYELEKNVNLVHFENNRIEISFNDNLDKNFIKDLSLKLFEWTGDRWIITLSKSKGELSIKDKQKNQKIKNINSAKQSKLYKNLIEKFPDADLIDVNPKEEND